MSQTDTVALKDLTIPSFRALLKRLSLKAPEQNSAKVKSDHLAVWQRLYNVLQCSAPYMDKFGASTPEQVNVLVDSDDKTLIRNVISVDEEISLYEYIEPFPCSICKSKVTYEDNDSGQGLQCTTCSLFYHNSCAPDEFRFTDQLVKALDQSPNNICVYCPNCMNNSNKPVTIADLAAKVEDIQVQVNKKPLVSQLFHASHVTHAPITANTPVAPYVSKAERDERTRVVIKPADVKVVSSRDIKKEMNKKYREDNICIENCFLTAGGSFIIELEDKAMAERLDLIWDVTLFNGNKGLKKLYQPTDNCMGVIKDIDDDGKDQEQLKAELREKLSLKEDAEIEFFTIPDRQTKARVFSGTVKVTFIDRKSLEKTAGTKIMINNQRAKVEEWHQKPKIKYCYKCLMFGHVSHRCRSKKRKCGKCSSDGHEMKDCIITDQSRFKCGHCGAKHATGAYNCPRMEDEMEKYKSQPHHGY